MLTNETVSLTSLISLTNTGLNIANFSQIKAALVAQYKYIYGDDIDIDDTTADGVFVNNISLLINNILQLCSDIYANLDVRTAVGEQLDILCALSNIRRKAATKSNTTLTVTYTGQQAVIYTPEEAVFIDKSGNEWLATSNISFTSQNESKSIYVECRKSGAISAPAYYIYQTIDATLPLTVVQSSDAYLGLEKEDDFTLRSRQVGSGSAIGMTTKSGLEASLRAISGIQDVKIINNSSNAAITANDTKSVPAHNVYVAIRYQDGVTVDDATIGNLIYNKLTSGIPTCQASLVAGAQKSYEVLTSVNGVSSSTFDTQMIYWKKCLAYGPDVTFTFTKYSWFTEDTCELIANRLMNYLSRLAIDTTPTATDLMIQAMQADPKFKGSPTYVVTTVPTFSTNPLSYYDYKYFTKSISGNTVTITLTRTAPSSNE